MSVPHSDDVRDVSPGTPRAVETTTTDATATTAAADGDDATGATDASEANGSTDASEATQAPDASDASLDAPDAALAAAAADDEMAPYGLDGLLAATGATPALLAAVERTGLLAPHHVDDRGMPRYSDADVAAVRAGMTLLDAGLPLGELLDLARRTDRAIQQIADHAIEAFLRFVRDPVRGTASSDEEAAARLVTAYEEMLPATERLVAHHLRRRLLTRAAERVAVELGDDTADGGGPGDAGPGMSESQEHPGDHGGRS